MEQYEIDLLEAIRNSPDPDAAGRWALNVILERLAAVNGDMPVSQVQALLRGEQIGRRNKIGARSVAHRAVDGFSRLFASAGSERAHGEREGCEWLRTKRS